MINKNKARSKVQVIARGPDQIRAVHEEAPLKPCTPAQIPPIHLSPPAQCCHVKATNKTHTNEITLRDKQHNCVISHMHCELSSRCSFALFLISFELKEKKMQYEGSPYLCWQPGRKKVFGLPALGASASERLQDRRASDQTEVFSVSTIRGAPQLNDSTEWALPHLTLQRFAPPPAQPASQPAIHPRPFLPPQSLSLLHGNANSCWMTTHSLHTPTHTHTNTLRPGRQLISHTLNQMRKPSAKNFGKKSEESPVFLGESISHEVSFPCPAVYAEPLHPAALIGHLWCHYDLSINFQRL